MKNTALPLIITVFLFLSASLLFAQSNDGEVQIYVFSPYGLPMEGVTVEVKGEVYRSDENGLVNFIHPPGTHRFTILQEGKPIGIVEVPIRQAEATEVIVTASDNPQLLQEKALEEEIAGEDRVELETDGPMGTLTGKIIDFDSGEPIADATILFRGVDFETSTDADGVFSARLPEGTYSFSVIHPDYSSQTRDDVAVTPEHTTEVEMTLTPSAIEMDEVPVFASEEVIVQGGIANLIEETRNSSVVLNLIGAEQISRTGDSDAAGALSRVTGLTVLNGKFVYVRGMGERYSSSLLNDARLPSPEPDRRVVPLDLFPASVIESIAVQKSYSPQLSGDFGGGAISIRTAGIPDDRYQRRLRTNISTSIGYNLGSSLTEQFTAQGGSLDFLGIDDGTRNLPEDIRDVEFLEPDDGGIFSSGTGLSEEDIADLGASLPNTWAPEQTTLPLDYGVSVSVRDKVELEDGGNFAYNIAGLYSSSADHTTGELNSYILAGTGELSPYNTYTTEETTQNVDLGALVDLAWEPKRHTTLEATTLLVRLSENLMEILEGELNDDNLDVQLTKSIWTEDMLLSQALRAETLLDGLNNSRLTGQYAFSLAQRYQPDARYYRYEEQLSGFTVDGYFDETYAHLADRREDDHQRVWTTVRDFVHDGQVSMEIPVFLGNRQVPDYLDLGLYGMYQNRQTDLRRFGFVPTGDVKTDEFYQGDAGDIFDPENIGDEIEFSEATYPADNYYGNHIIGAGYLSTDALLFRDIRLNTGVRLEYSRQSLHAYTFPNPEEENPILQNFDVMPALNLTFPVFKGSQIRLGGSRTINRPDLRELSSAPFFGPPGFGVIQGNPDLQRASIWNVDLRWESYLSLNESFSIGAFYKNFQDPIEIAQLHGAAYTKVPVNTQEAMNIGAEFEWALQFRYLSDGLRKLMLAVDFDSARAERRFRRTVGGLASFLRDLRTTGNIALIHSAIDYGDGNLTYQGVTLSNTSSERPLQGQAPYVVNVALGYRNDVSWNQSKPVHTSFFLNYNVVGPFIYQIGVDNVDDFYQQPFHQLDLVFSQQLGHIVSVSLEAGNLLDPLATRTAGLEGEVVEQSRRGRTFSFSVSLDI